jgi:importin subunit beta-1
MKALVESLKDSRIMKEVKPPVLSCFGEIALAIGGAYEPYLATSVMMLMQASEARVPEDDEDMIDFFNELRESILESYMGIIQGLRDGGKLPTFMQYMQPVLLFIQRIAEDPNRDEEVLNKSVGLVGDIAQLMGPQMKQHLNQPWVGQLLNDAVSSGDQSLMEVATWAHGVVQQACQG